MYIESEKMREGLADLVHHVVNETMVEVARTDRHSDNIDLHARIVDVLESYHEELVKILNGRALKEFKADIDASDADPTWDLAFDVAPKIVEVIGKELKKDRELIRFVMEEM